MMYDSPRSMCSPRLKELDPSVVIKPMRLVRHTRYENWVSGKKYLEENEDEDRIKVAEHCGWSEKDDKWEFWVLRSDKGTFHHRIVRNGLVVSQDKLH